MNLPLTEKQINYLRERKDEKNVMEWALHFNLTMGYMYRVLSELQIKVKRVSPGTYDKSKFIIRKKNSTDMSESERKYIESNRDKPVKQLAKDLKRTYHSVSKYLKANPIVEKKVSTRPPAVYSNRQWVY